VTFFFDNHHAPEIVEILRKAEVDARHLREEFAEGTLDTVWIPQVAERGWILITGDHKIARRKEEKRIFRQVRLTTFFLSKEYNNKKAINRIKWITTQWEKIDNLAQRAEPGDCFVVPFKGAIRKLAEDEPPR
jgi:hypothetical protein